MIICMSAFFIVPCWKADRYVFYVLWSNAGLLHSIDGSLEGERGAGKIKSGLTSFIHHQDY